MDRSLGRRALFGVGYISVILLAVGLLIAQSQGVFRDPVVVTGEFASVGDGLPVGSDVKLRGVIVGRVAAVDASPGRFDVEMELQPEFADQVPASVQARILPTNLFGAPFVDLRIAGEEGPAIEAGATVPEDLSAGSVQMQTVFQKVYDVLVAVKPAKLNETLTAIADAMRGNGDRIGHMIERAESYVSALNRHAEVFKDDLGLLADALDGVDQAAPDLLASMDDVSAVARVFVEERVGLQRLLAAGIDASDRAGDFIREQGPRIIRFLDQTARFAGIVAPNAIYIERSLVALGSMAGQLASIAPGNTGAHIEGYLVTTEFPTYTSADCPRYGSLAGRNCDGSNGRLSGRLRPAPDYGGTTGSVGTPEEQRLIGQMTGAQRGDETDLATVLLGPVIRGGTVVSR